MDTGITIDINIQMSEAQDSCMKKFMNLKLPNYNTLLIGFQSYYMRNWQIINKANVIPFGYSY